jgi:hypothetical protein
MPGSPPEPGTTAETRSGGGGRYGLAVVAGLGLFVLVFFLVEASLRKTPWLFTDELEWSQLSRAIASTGHAARRGEPHSFESIYAFLIAPAWWIHSTSTAYSAIKDLNTVVMALAAVPTYFLGRMLLSRRVALVVALLSIAIPAMAYATSIVPEPLAYLWFTLTALCTVRALSAPSVRTIVPAVLLAAVGIWVRTEFVDLPAAFVLAAAILWVLGPPTWRARLRRIVLAAVALALFGFVFNELVVQQVQSWSFKQYFNSSTPREGSLAAGALVIGLGVGPAICGIASLRLRERAADPVYRAFAAYLFSCIVALFVYTAAKATYLSVTLHSLIEERNLFFLSPLLLIGSAMVLLARRVEWWLVAVASVLVVATSWSSLLIVGQPYFEAPGLSVLTIANRYFFWDMQDFRFVLVGLAMLTILVIAFRARRYVVPAAVILATAWLLAGEIYATISNDNKANADTQVLPAPRNWVDADTHGAHVTFIGQGIADPTEMWLTEFWNRSVDRVESLDGSAPGPGPAPEPGLETTDGALSMYTGNPYTLAGPGVVLAAPIVDRRDGYTLYRTPVPWHLQTEEQNVFSDGWGTTPIGYTYFPKGGPGTLVIDLSRTAYRGAGPPGHATIRVGTVRLDQNGTPQLDTVLAVRHAVVRNGKEVTTRIPVTSTPVEVQITFPKSSTFNVPPDPRILAAQPGFRFIPAKR